MFDMIDDDGIRNIGKIITLEDVMRLPKGIGGRIGVVPWFMAHVVGVDGERRATPMVRLCVTNHLYLSDVGGGFKATRTAYEGLEKELTEEAPAWKDEILLQLRNPRTFFLAVEQFQAYPGSKRPIPLQILAFVHVVEERLRGFEPTSEIRAVLDRTLDQFHEVVDRRPNIGSLGIRIYHLLRRHAALRAAVDPLFRARVQEVEYKEEDLVDNKVEVLLANGVSKATFNKLVRDNSNFSKNLNKAWPMREAYAKQQMSRQTAKSPSRSPHVSNEKEKENGFVVVQKNKLKKGTSGSKNSTKKSYRPYGSNGKW